jgi:hypothetical protein
MIKALLLSLLFVVPAFAGPPKDAQKVMRPYPSICTPTLESILGAMTEDYAVHVSATFKESDTSFVMIVENPNTKTMAVVHINMDGRACLVFSGLDLKRFERPEGMAPPKVDINKENEGT